LGQLNSTFRRRVVGHPPSSYVSPSILRNISIEDWTYLSQFSGEYFYNKPSNESIEIAEMKIDEVRPWPKSDPVYDYAQVIADRMLEVPLTAKEWTDQETLDHLILTKGPGIPWKFLGYKTRQQLFNSDEWKDNYENIDFLKRLMPIYESVGKEELAEITDLHDKKVRTFQTTAAHLLYWQLRLYGQGNENLKKYKWSKYGFNPFYGGTNQWYKEINVVDENGCILYRVRVCWDISGYDRKIFLHYVAERRFRYWCQANQTSIYKDIARWVADAWKRSIIFFHNGDVCVRLRGNNSGSGTTTTNNIEAGFEVVADLLVHCYLAKYKEYPPLDLITQQLIALFGDDNAMFLMEQFDFMLDEAFVKKRLFEQHGLICKWLVGGVEHPFSKLPFLGFTFSPYKGFFIPKWSIERLIHPILYTPNRKTTGQYLQQVYSLMIMSFAHFEIYLKIREVYIKLLQYFKGSGQADVKIMLDLGVPTVEEVEIFYLGLEGTTNVSLDIVTGGGGPLLNIIMSDSKESKISDTRPCGECLPDCSCAKCLEFKDLILSLLDNRDQHLCVAPNLGVRDGLFQQCPHCSVTTRDLNSEGRYSGRRVPGTYDEYGNQCFSASYVQYFIPSYRTNPTGGVECYSTILFSDRAPMACIGSGSNQSEAFSDWYSTASTFIMQWEPDTKWGKFYKELRSLPKPPDGHPLAFMWHDDYTLHHFNLLKLCGDIEQNPGPLSKMQYLQQNKLSFDKLKLTAAQRNQKYSQYLAKAGPRGPMTSTKQPRNNQIVSTKAQRNKVSNSQIGAKNYSVNRVPNAVINQRKQARSIMNVSECSREYFAALTCPFYWTDDSCNSFLRNLGLNFSEKKDPCIPLAPNLKSRKTHFFARGTFAVSSLGLSPSSANISFSPRRLANNNGGDQSSPPILIQGAGFVTGADSIYSTTLDTNNPATGMTFNSFNSEYTQAELVLINTRGVRYRVVGAGLRIQYTGSEVNMAGTIHAFVQPNHDTLQGVGVAVAGQYETYFRTPVSKDWVTLSHTPVVQDDFEFMPDFPSNPSAYTGFFSLESQQHYMGFIVTDCPNGTFNYEAILLCEITGQTVRGLTPTVVDTVGVSAVLNGATTAIAPELNKIKDFAPILNSGIDLVSAFVPEAQALKFATPMANKLANMLM